MVQRYDKVYSCKLFTRFLFNISFSELGRMQSHQMILKSVERGGVEVEVA